MAVGFSKTNKPLNPRGNDQSPKGYNRAALYSGKALDFDGVNDSVSLGAVSGTLSNLSMSWYVKTTYTGDFQCLFNDGQSYFDVYIRTDKKLHIWTGSEQLFDEIPDIQTGEWVNLVLVVDGANASLYYNGQLAQTIAFSGSSFSISNGFVGIGKNSLYDYNGEMAGFKLFSTALTAAQVSDLYNNPEKIVPTGVADSALKLWLPMQEGAGTYCINGADPLGDDVYDGAGSFDSATGWTLNTATSITGGKLVVDGTQTSTTAAYYNVVSLSDKMVFAEFTLSNVTAGSAWLVFFGSGSTQTKQYDSDGTYTELIQVTSGHNGNTGFFFSSDFVGDIDNLTIKEVSTGTISGATWQHGIGAPIAQTAVIDWNKKRTSNTIDILLPQGLTSGRDITGVNLFENVRKQGALNLDGNSWAEVHDNASLDISDCSLEAWVCLLPESVSTWQTVFSKVSQANLQIYFDANDKLSHYNSTTAGGILDNTSFNKNEWNHFILVEDGSDVLTYVNGVLQSTKTISLQMDGDGVFFMGAHTTSGADAINAQIAQPRIYNRALTAAEVLQNYNSGKSIYTNS